MVCQPAGNPPPAVSWLKDGAAVQESTRVSVDDSDSLVFSSVFSTDAGSYTCLASSSIGSTSVNTVLTVLGVCMCVHACTCVCVCTCLCTCVSMCSKNPVSFPPVVPLIQQSAERVTVNEGDRAVIDCVATGSPEPVVSWFHGSNPLPTAGKIPVPFQQRQILDIISNCTHPQASHVYNRQTTTVC